MPERSEFMAIWIFELSHCICRIISPSLLGANVYGPFKQNSLVCLDTKFLAVAVPDNEGKQEIASGRFVTLD